MVSGLIDASLLTESNIDALACQFLRSAYADNTHIGWTLDRRLEGFLRRRGLRCLVEDGDAYGLIMDRVMVRIGGASRAGLPRAARNTTG